MATIEIRASAFVGAPPDRVFEFLSDLRNHWRLERRFVELAAVSSDGAVVRIRGPVGTRRCARTRVARTQAPASGRGGALEGTAWLGARTRAAVRWDIEPTTRGSRVALRATVDEASKVDRLLLQLGGAAWLAAIFRSALANLDAELGGTIRSSGRMLDWLDDGLTAGLVAAIASGLPSTLAALGSGNDPLEATRAAGSILAGANRPRPVLLAAAVPVHGALSLGWSLVLARLLPRRRTVAAGAVAGLAIAAVDLGLVGRRFALVKQLPLAPQLADHVAFGAVVGAVLARRWRRA